MDAIELLSWARELSAGCTEEDAVSALVYRADGDGGLAVHALWEETRERILIEGIHGGPDLTRVQRILAEVARRCGEDLDVG